MRTSRFSGFILFVTALAGCSAAPTPISSTQGTTLVQMAQVTAVRNVAIAGNQSPGIGGAAGNQMEKSTDNKIVTELTVRFDNGDVRTVNIEPGETFQVGERVRVSRNKGNTRITH